MTYGKPLRKRIVEATLAELDSGRPLTRVAAELGRPTASIPRTPSILFFTCAEGYLNVEVYINSLL